MTYTLHALIARKGSVLEDEPFSAWPSVSLTPGFRLLPLSTDLRAGCGASEPAWDDLYDVPSAFLGNPVSEEVVEATWNQRYDLPAAFVHRLVGAPYSFPVACVWAEYSGGMGAQVSMIFDSGRVISRSTSRTAINEALDYLGIVAATGRVDAFDTVNLGSHRRTDDWQ